MFSIYFFEIALNIVISHLKTGGNGSRNLGIELRPYIGFLFCVILSINICLCGNSPKKSSINNNSLFRISVESLLSIVGSNTLV